MLRNTYYYVWSTEHFKLIDLNKKDINLNSSLLYVANWKMNMHAQSATEFVDLAKEWVKNNPELKRRIILCPTFSLLLPLKIELSESGIYLGAQNCSEHDHGAYTGQVSAQDLVEIGADFCLVGHSECRKYLNESNESIGKKVTQLFNHLLNPIICIGETAQDHSLQRTLEALEQQLFPVAHAVKVSTSWPNVLTIAYEPVWAIGTGIIPKIEEIEKVFEFIKSYTATHIPQIETIRILYGGSVDATNVSALKAIQGLDGFLIGGASLDFQKFKNIVGLD